jgi:histidine decarboxylase
VQAILDALTVRVNAAREQTLGFPAATDFDYRPLAPLLAGHLLNNLGDPYVDGAYPSHTKEQEREVIDTVADLLRAPTGNRWGYVTSGATEATEYALHQARELHPTGLVYHSTAAHHSIPATIDRLRMSSIAVRADTGGEIDYHDLAGQVGVHRDSPAIVVANIGTAHTEAIDDVSRIVAVLDRHGIRRRFVHADAALAGLPLALIDTTDPRRPRFDMADGADSIVVSGHKFIGTPLPCAVLLIKASHRAHTVRATPYTRCPDTTLTNSRNGLAALMFWYALRTRGIAGLRERAQASRDLAAYTHRQLVRIRWDAHRHPHAFTVTLATPPDEVLYRWTLAVHGERSAIVCMPGTTSAQIDAFIADLRAAIPARRNGRVSRLPGTRRPAASTPA